MPRYFFNVLDGVNVDDTEGSELADVEAARMEALRSAGVLINSLCTRRESWVCEDWMMKVSDEDGQVVATLRFMASAMPDSPA